jgi:hypothetical protein
MLSACSPPTSLASGAPLMSAMMMRPPMSLRRRRLLGRSREAVCEGGGEHLAAEMPTPPSDAAERRYSAWAVLLAHTRHRGHLPYSRRRMLTA